MRLGTNDVCSNSNLHLPSSVTFDPVDEMRAYESNIHIFVAQITPMTASGCSASAGGIINLNNAIPAWGARESTSQSPIKVVDCFTGYNTATDTCDGVHPNDSGNKKLANAWFEPLKEAISAVNFGTNPPASTTPNPPGGGGTSTHWEQCGGQE